MRSLSMHPRNGTLVKPNRLLRPNENHRRSALFNINIMFNFLQEGMFVPFQGNIPCEKDGNN